MPLQHTCYLPDPSSDPGAHPPVYRIYRGPESGLDPPPCLAGPGAQWLLDVVALRHQPSEEPQVLRGLQGVQDGDLVLEDGAVVDLELGDGDRLGLHERCWRLAGSGEAAAVGRVAGTRAWRELEGTYHSQLFDLARLERDGNAWMLADPGLDTEDGARNRARILSLVAGASPGAPRPR
eukprot:CAMPEP_0206006290 /NCGR_PEP_ID=MMETSP1464-20131121/5087_1 /ASSEMBLY_ACC=CAM_ASM_001124 /TAXON_ID=119497 /ORGANISM="Exanthemachrysis gayraliae, Strain RCC1523" /LENGTH=178 /DNA_ID=CAMNT_0053379757 /DNA_START=1 /DNA_END=537 /DNA_ORIENTATION=-